MSLNGSHTSTSGVQLLTVGRVISVGLEGSVTVEDDHSHSSAAVAPLGARHSTAGNYAGSGQHGGDPHSGTGGVTSLFGGDRTSAGGSLSGSRRSSNTYITPGTKLAALYADKGVRGVTPTPPLTTNTSKAAPRPPSSRALAAGSGYHEEEIYNEDDAHAVHGDLEDSDLDMARGMGMTSQSLRGSRRVRSAGAPDPLDSNYHNHNQHQQQYNQQYISTQQGHYTGHQSTFQEQQRGHPFMSGSSGNRNGGSHAPCIKGPLEGGKVKGNAAGIHPGGLKSTSFARRLSGDSILPSISPGSPMRARPAAHRW
jgi:hypothetical protein